MRTTRLAFNDLQNGFDVIAQENLRSIKGGVASSTGDNPFAAWISSQLGQPAITGQDAEGNLTISVDGGTTWMSVVFQLDSVSVSGIGNWNRPSMFNSVYDGFHAAWADTYGQTYGLTGGSGSVGGGNNNNPNDTFNFNNFLSSLVSTTSTSIYSQFSQVSSSSLSGYTGLNTFTGYVTTPSSTNSLFTLNTTISNGVLASFDISLGTTSVSFLAEGGFSISSTVNGIGYNLGMSQTQGFLYGSSVNLGNFTGGFEYNHVPGINDIAVALCIIAAFETGGTSLAGLEGFGGVLSF